MPKIRWNINSRIFKICLQIVSWAIQFSFYLLYVWLVISMIWSLGSTDILTCQHSPNEPPTCQQQSWRLLGLHHQTAEWQLESVEVVEDNSGDGTNYYILSLATSQGEVKLPYYFNNRDEAYQDLERFVQFIETSSRPPLYLKQNYNFFENFIVIIFACPAILVFAFFCSLLYLKFFRGVGRRLNSRVGKTHR